MLTVSCSVHPSPDVVIRTFHVVHNEIILLETMNRYYGCQWIMTNTLQQSSFPSFVPRKKTYGNDNDKCCIVSYGFVHLHFILNTFNEAYDLKI